MEMFIDFAFKGIYQMEIVQMGKILSLMRSA